MLKTFMNFSKTYWTHSTLHFVKKQIVTHLFLVSILFSEKQTVQQTEVDGGHREESSKWRLVHGTGTFL